MADLLRNLTIRPDINVRSTLSTDLLSHVLAQLRLTGESVDSRQLVARQVVDLDRDLAHIIVVTDGELMLEAQHDTPTVIATGDLLLMPHGTEDMRLAATDTPAGYINCCFWFDADSLRSMVHALPPSIHLRKQDGAAWLEGIIQFAMMEARDREPGAALMISRLIDLLVIRTLRSWVHRGHTSGWLGCLADARIGRAVMAIHENPNRRWSIDALAAIAEMSRSSFCDRFSTLVGRSPQRYSNDWRLALARDMLSKPDARVGQIGLNIGYQSEGAFSRAYKALYGHSPRVEFKRRHGFDPA